jgi:hypothetical protein
MEFLERFQPRLVGAVLDGTADDHSPIDLHVFTDDSDTVGHFLTDHGIPYDREDRQLRIDPQHAIVAPVYLFAAGEAAFALTTLPMDGLRQSPMRQGGREPMQRSSLAHVRNLLDSDDAGFTVVGRGS